MTGQGAGSASGPEVLFYELQRETLEAALIPLLEKSLARGWKAVVRAGTRERIEALDAHLWTYRPESFLPHGTSTDGHAERQPVYLTHGNDNPAKAEVLFLVDGAAPDSWDDAALNALARVVLVFDGGSEEARASARIQWTAVRKAGFAATYWKQSETGRWEKQGG